MKLKYDKLLSNIAFKFNLRRYVKEKLKKAIEKGKGLHAEKQEVEAKVAEREAEIAQLNSTMEGIKSSSGAEVAEREVALAGVY